MSQAAATYPVGTIAALLLLTVRRVQQLTEQGIIPKAERGQYALAPAVQGYVKFLRDRALNGDAGDSEVGADKARMVKAKRRVAEVTADAMEGSKIDRAKTLELVQELAQADRDAVLAWPARAAPVMAAELGVDQHALHAALDAGLRAHLTERAEIHLGV